MKLHNNLCYREKNKKNITKLFLSEKLTQNSIKNNIFSSRKEAFTIYENLRRQRRTQES